MKKGMILIIIFVFFSNVMATPTLEGVTGLLNKPNALTAPHLNFHFNLLGWVFPYHFTHSAMAAFGNRVEIAVQVEYTIWRSDYFDSATPAWYHQPYFNTSFKFRWLGPLKGINLASMLCVDIASRYFFYSDTHNVIPYTTTYNPRFSFYTMATWSYSIVQLTVGLGMTFSGSNFLTDGRYAWIDAFIGAEINIYKDIVLFLVEFSNYSYNSINSFYRSEYRGIGNIGFRFNPNRWISITIVGYDIVDGNRHFGITFTLKVGGLKTPRKTK